MSCQSSRSLFVFAEILLALCFPLGLRGKPLESDERTQLSVEKCDQAEIVLQQYHILGNSMYPTLKNGDCVWVDPRYSFWKLRTGDIVAMQSKEFTIIHRIRKRLSHGRWLTMGDNNAYTDRFFLCPSNYLGKVVLEPASNPK